MREKSPAFQFYPKDWLTDAHVRVMSMQERGAYITLICLYWIEGSLPADLRLLARLCGVPLPTFRKLWPAIERCFVCEPEHPDRLLQPRLERERAKQETFHRRQSDRGKTGADHRWHKHSQEPDACAMPAPLPPRHAEAMLSDSSSSSSSSTPVRTPAEPDGFGVFWMAYPRKVAKEQAVRAWKKLKPSLDAQQRILNAIGHQRNSEQWRKDGGAFIPYPATWLNGRRWEDEAPVVAVPPSAQDDWFEECQRLHNRSCNGSAGHRVRMLLDADKESA